MADALQDFEELCRALKIPVLTTWNGIDLIEENDPLYYGRPGGLGHRYANFIQQNSDFFLSIGARLNLLQTGYNFDGFARGAYKVMVDIDEAELHKINVRPDLPICADAGEFIRALLKHQSLLNIKDRIEWFSYCDRMKEKYPMTLHIDNAAVTRVDSRTKTFAEFPLSGNDDTWSKEIMDVIGGMETQK